MNSSYLSGIRLVSYNPVLSLIHIYNKNFTFTFYVNEMLNTLHLLKELIICKVMSVNREFHS